MTLDKIATDTTSTDNERLLATAIKNIDKKVSPADKSIMMKIWLSPAASESEREMAGILLRLNQTPGDSAKHLLSEWAK